MLRTTFSVARRRGWVSTAAALAASLGTQAFGPAQAAQQSVPRTGFDTRIEWFDPSRSFGVPGFAAGLLPHDLFVAHDDELRLYDTRDGTHTIAHQLPAGHAIGVLVSDPLRLDLRCIDFGANSLVTLSLLQPTATTQPAVANAFDLAIHPLTRTNWVSANPTWPQAGSASGVWHIDPAGGTAHLEVIRLSGPSGPLVFDAQSRDLFVAELPQQVPPAPGSVRVLRFSAAQLNARLAGGSPRLGSQDGVVVLTGLDGAYDMVFDAARRLLISDVNGRTVHRTTPHPVQTPGPGSTASLELPPLAAPGAGYPTNLQYLAGGPGTFEPFQPSSSGRLLINSNEPGIGTAVVALHPARPGLEFVDSTGSPRSVFGPGPLTLQAADLPVAAPVWLCLSPAPLPMFETEVLRIADRPLWLGLDLLTPFVAVPIGAATQAGTLTLPLSHPGTTTAFELSLQAIALDASGSISTPVSSVARSVRLTP